jgi:hypothetical protein
MVLTTGTVTVFTSLTSSETLAVQLQTLGVPAIALGMTSTDILEILVQILFGIDNKDVLLAMSLPFSLLMC